MKKRVECKITGRVQMVMFRDFTTRKAKSLDLIGFVKNLEDGSVFAVAEGDEINLKKWIRFLNKGSILSRVDGVEVFWTEPKNKFLNFKITYKNEKK
jgi:acylphosphatase